MGSTALVTTEVFSDRSGTRYVFPTHDVHVMSRVYVLWTKRARDKIYPIRVEMSKHNWALLRSWFQQFRYVTDEDISWVSEDIAESGILYEVQRRMENPEFMRKQAQHLREFLEYLSHEPTPC